jgi:hypothetical protein
MPAIFHCYSELRRFATVFSHFIILLIILEILSVFFAIMLSHFSKLLNHFRDHYSAQSFAKLLSHFKMSTARGVSTPQGHASRSEWLTAPTRAMSCGGRTHACSIGRLTHWIQVIDLWPSPWMMNSGALYIYRVVLFIT